MRYKILTKNGMGNTNIDGARAEHFNAGMRDGIVKGAFNEGTFTTLASNEIFFDTCELRISGHRVLVEEAWSSTFSTRPKTPTRFAVIGQIIVGEDSSVQFDLFAQLASTALIKNNLFKQQNGAGTYQVEIGRFTLNTDRNIIDVARTLDIITGSRAEDLDGTINIGNITTNTLNPGMEAEFDVEQRYDPEQEKVVTDFTVGIPQGEKGLTADGVEELISGKADLRNPSQSINANSLSLSSLDENYIAGINLTGFSGDHASIKMTSNGLEFRTFDAGNDRNNAAMMFKGATFIDMVAGSISLNCTDHGQIQLETSTTVNGNLTVNGENVITQSSLLKLVYPVGSIYISVNNVSPASFLGGTWEQLKDRFLLGAGDIYSNGVTGGEATHTLLENEMPSHTHTQNPHRHTFNGYNTNGTILVCTGSKDQYSGPFTTTRYGAGPSGSGGWWEAYLNINYTPSGVITETTATNNYTGGGEAHNNMPPYLAVYMWKRVS